MPLTLTSITHSYDGRMIVLSDVNLAVADGETIAIIGPSGSGKSTLLSIAGALLQSSGGVLQVDGRTISAETENRTQFRATTGWVMQTVNTLARRTALDNVVLPLLARGSRRSAAYRVARSALTTVGLDAQADQRVHTLSGGEVQRLCIARAVVHEPRFVLADEPTGQLDSATTETVLNALWGAVAGPRTLITASHDPAVSERCDRVVFLADGRLHEL